jgi:hypothetical protein
MPMALLAILPQQGARRCRHRYRATKPLRIFRHSPRKVRGAGSGWGAQAAGARRQSSSFGGVECFGSGMACIFVSLFGEGAFILCYSCHGINAYN